MYTDLNGKVAVVSGAGGSLGTAVARRLRAEDLRLVLTDRSEEGLQRIVQDLNAPTGALITVAADIANPAAVDALAEQALAAFGRVDILVNVAGAFKMGLVHEMTEADLDLMLTVNLKTAFLLSAAVARTMLARGGAGRIINISSRAALAGTAGLAAYSASKAALLRLTESMAAELSDHGITVNAILPSTLDTPANRKAMPDADFSKWVSTESLSDVVAFLASAAARDISGAAIPVYGRS